MPLKPSTLRINKPARHGNSETEFQKSGKDWKIKKGYAPRTPRMIPEIQIQDPKVEVLYHIRPYFVGIFPYKALYMIGTSNLGS